MANDFIIKIISPKNGQIFQANTGIEIAWIYNRSVNIYYRRGLLGEKILVVSNVNTNSYIWTLPDESIPDLVLSVEDYASGEIYAKATVRISVYKGSSINPYYPKVLHGSGNPYFELFDAQGNIVTSFEADRPIALIERWEPEGIVHKLLNGKKKFILKGFWYQCLLDFSAYTRKEQLIHFGDLFTNLRHIYDGINKSIVLYPRGYDYQSGGNPHYSYKVELDFESIVELQQLQFRQGHKLFTLKLVGVERLYSIPFTMGDDLVTAEMNKALPYGIESGYGDTYGEDYGNAL